MHNCWEGDGVVGVGNAARGQIAEIPRALKLCHFLSKLSLLSRV